MQGRLNRFRRRRSRAGDWTDGNPSRARSAFPLGDTWYSHAELAAKARCREDRREEDEFDYLRVRFRVLVSSRLWVVVLTKGGLGKGMGLSGRGGRLVRTPEGIYSTLFVFCQVHGRQGMADEFGILCRAVAFKCRRRLVGGIQTKASRKTGDSLDSPLADR